MRPAFRVTFVLLIILQTCAPIIAQQKVPSELVGSYLFRFQWGGTHITLKNDGTFIHQSSDCTSVTTESGPYSFSKDVLNFTVLKITRRGFDNNKEIDLRKRKARKEFLETDEPFKPEHHELRVVRWGERIYLMPDSEFERFIDAINLGFEPRQVDGYRTLYGYIFLRVGDENKDVSGAPSLPSEFVSMLLNAPIIATVLQLETVDKEAIVTIDRGSSDGLRKGMTLVPLVTSNPYYFEICRVLSLEEHSAKVEVFDGVKVGDKLTTRVADVSRYAQLQARASNRISE